MWKRIGYWLLIFLMLVIMNAATICWIVYNYIPSPVDSALSMWDISILKSQLHLATNQYLSIPEKATIYLFMIIGAVMSACFIWWVFKDTLQQVRERAKEKKDKAFKKYKKQQDLGD